MIYHGVSKEHIYSQEIALLDFNDPTKVLARQSEPILEHELNWELFGHVDNVVYSYGQVIINDEVYGYYGCADNAFGLATMKLSEISF